MMTSFSGIGWPWSRSQISLWEVVVFSRPRDLCDPQVSLVSCFPRLRTFCCSIPSSCHRQKLCRCTVVGTLQTSFQRKTPEVSQFRSNLPHETLAAAEEIVREFNERRQLAGADRAQDGDQTRFTGHLRDGCVRKHDEKVAHVPDITGRWIVQLPSLTGHRTDESRIQSSDFET